MRPDRLSVVLPLDASDRLDDVGFHVVMEFVRGDHSPSSVLDDLDLQSEDRGAINVLWTQVKAAVAEGNGLEPATENGREVLRGSGESYSGEEPYQGFFHQVLAAEILDHVGRGANV